jgi:hypothetical protein
MKQTIKGRMVRLLALATVAVASMLTGESTLNTAEAASGGGCSSGGLIDACISYHHDRQVLIADFYLNGPPSGNCYVDLQIVKNGRVVKQARYTLGSPGRYGPIENGTATAPPSRGSAYSRARVYTCSGHFHFAPVSPVVYYP